MVEPKVLTNNFLWPVPGESLTPYPHYADIVEMMNAVDFDLNSIIPKDRTVPVSINASELDNGTALIAAYDRAKTLSPSASKRVLVILPPAVYDLADNKLVVDTDFIDLICEARAEKNGKTSIDWTDVKIAGAQIKSSLDNEPAAEIKAQQTTISGLHFEKYGTTANTDFSCEIHPVSVNKWGALMYGCSFENQGISCVVECAPGLINCHARNMIFGPSGSAVGGLVKNCSMGSGKHLHVTGNIYEMFVDDCIINYVSDGVGDAVLNKTTFKNCKITGDNIFFVNDLIAGDDSENTKFIDCEIDGTSLLHTAPSLSANRSKFERCTISLEKSLSLGLDSFFKNCNITTDGADEAAIKVESLIQQISNSLIKTTFHNFAIESFSGGAVSSFPILGCIINATTGTPIDPNINYQGGNVLNGTWVDETIFGKKEANILKVNGVNQDTADLDLLDIVYISGGDTDPYFNLANSEVFDQSRMIGIITGDNIPPGQPAEAIAFGPYDGIPTDTIGPEGTVFYLNGNGKITTTKPTGGNFCIAVGIVTKSDPTNGSLFINPHLSEYTKESNYNVGFEENPFSFLLYEFDDSERKLTLRRVGKPWHYYQKGEKFISGTEDPLNPGEYIDEIIIGNSEGNHLIWYDNDGNLADQINPSTGTVASLMRSNTFVAWLQWNATDGELITLGREPHQFLINPTSHSLWHFNIGATWQGGLSLNSFVIGNGSLDSHAQFGVDLGFHSDEDLFREIGPYISTEGISVMYRSGIGGDWRRDPTNNFAVKSFVGGGGRLAFNQNVGGDYQQTEVTSGNYVLCHLFASNDVWNFATKLTDEKGVLSVQGINEYSTLNNAIEGAQSEIFEILSPGPSKEVFPIATVIFQTSNSYSNTVLARIVQPEAGQNYLNWLTTEFSQAPPPTSHLNLNDLNGGAGDGGHSHMTLLGGRNGGQTITGGLLAGEDLTLKDNAAEETSVTVTQLYNAVIRERIIFNFSEPGILENGLVINPPESGGAAAGYLLPAYYSLKNIFLCIDESQVDAGDSINITIWRYLSGSPVRFNTGDATSLGTVIVSYGSAGTYYHKTEKQDFALTYSASEQTVFCTVSGVGGNIIASGIQVIAEFEKGEELAP